MSITPADRVTVVQPGEGEAAGLTPGIGVVFKLEGGETGGALAIVEQPFEMGGLVPPHVHTREDEISIVIEGTIGFRSEDQEVVLGPGGYIVKPRGQVHAMWNAGDIPARIIEVIFPAGFEGFFREVAAMAAAGPPDMQKILELGERYELQGAQPDWLADVIERYNLNPPPVP